MRFKGIPVVTSLTALLGVALVSSSLSATASPTTPKRTAAAPAIAANHAGAAKQTTNPQARGTAPDRTQATSLDELEASWGRFSHSKDLLDLPGIVAYPDYATSTIHITYPASLATELRSRILTWIANPIALGSWKIVTEASPDPFIEQGISRDGDPVNNVSSICTLGFNAVKNAKDHMITAGHCAKNKPAYWYWGFDNPDSDYIGTTYAAITDSELGDYAVIQYSSLSPYFAARELNGYDGYTSITSVGEVGVGVYVCANGQYSHKTCGLVRSNDATVTYAGTGNTYHHMVLVDAATVRGDSGAPLTRYGKAIGVLSGGNGTSSAYTKMSLICARYGLDPVN